MSDENVEKPERCPVKLYKKYISHVPSGTSDNSFYLRLFRKPKGNVVKKVMGKAGFDGDFTTHSLRRSCATKLYGNNNNKNK